MMTKERMSRIVIHNDTIYLCGQVAEDADQGIQEQTRTMLATEIYTLSLHDALPI